MISLKQFVEYLWNKIGMNIFNTNTFVRCELFWIIVKHSLANVETSDEVVGRRQSAEPVPQHCSSHSPRRRAHSKSPLEFPTKTYPIF